MSKTKKTSIAKAINNIIVVVDRTDLTFDKKRSTIINNIKDYYIHGKLSSEEIIERKNSMESDKTMLHNYFIPFLVGASSALLSQGLVDSFLISKPLHPLIALLFTSIVVAVFFGLFYLVYKFIYFILYSRSRYEKYGILDCELEIIEMVLEARSLLQSNAK